MNEEEIKEHIKKLMNDFRDRGDITYKGFLKLHSELNDYFESLGAEWESSMRFDMIFGTSLFPPDLYVISLTKYFLVVAKATKEYPKATIMFPMVI